MANQTNPPSNPSPINADTEIPDKDMPSPILEEEALPKPPQLKKSRKGLKVVAIVSLVLVLAAAAAWFFLLRDNDQPEPQTQTQAPAAEETLTTNDVPEATNTESFTSSPYRITFKHPKTWKVTENNDNSLLIQSEDFAYKTASGETKNGNFRVYIRKGGQQADSDIIAKGVAIQASSKLVYSNPTAAQRTETNLSLFGLDTVNNFAFLLITSNFTMQKGDALGPNFGQEPEAIIVGGGFSEPALEPGMATNPVPTEGFQDTNAYKQAIGIIETLEIM